MSTTNAAYQSWQMQRLNTFFWESLAKRLEIEMTDEMLKLLKTMENQESEIGTIISKATNG